MATILVMEDDCATAEEIAIELRGNGFEVEVANNGRLGLSRAMREQSTARPSRGAFGR